MAVDTTVQVTLPAMGESVTEGTVLEWHKQEGDHVEADEVLVEISTDKVDAEVPSPAAGRSRRSTSPRATPSRSAPCSPRSPPAMAPRPPRRRRRRAGRGGAATARRREAERGRRPRRRHRHPDRRRVGHRGHDPRVARQAPATPSTTASRRRDLDRQGRHRAALPHRRHDHRDPLRRGRHRHRRAGHRAHDDATNGAVAGPPPAAPRREPAARATAPRRAAAPDGRQGLPRRRAHGRRRGRRPRTASPAPAPAGASRSPTSSTSRTAAGPRRPADRARRRRRHQGRRGDARAVHGREPVDPDRDLVPHDHRHHDGRPAQAAQGRRREASPSPTSSPTRSRWPANDMPVMAHHFDEVDGKPHRFDDGAREPRHRRRRREEGRQPAR